MKNVLRQGREKIDNDKTHRNRIMPSSWKKGRMCIINKAPWPIYAHEKRLSVRTQPATTTDTSGMHHHPGDPARPGRGQGP